MFVEKVNAALNVLRENLDALGLEDDRTEVVKGDAWEPELDGAPDLIFFDPPYAKVAEDPVRAAASAVGLAARLAPGGLLCFHFEDGQLDADDFDDDLEVELRQWGRSAVALIGRG